MKSPQYIPAKDERQEALNNLAGVVGCMIKRGKPISIKVVIPTQANVASPVAILTVGDAP